MLVRGEANPAVSIIEPSLEAALISGFTGAVLFTTAPSLTLLIPNGFGLRGGSTATVQRYNVKLLYALLVDRSYFSCCSCLKMYYFCLTVTTRNSWNILMIPLMIVISCNSKQDPQRKDWYFHVVTINACDRVWIPANSDKILLFLTIA